MEAYSPIVERHMVEFFKSLSEKDRRRYAAVEAEKLGHGGLVYVARLFGCDEDTDVRAQGLPHPEHRHETERITGEFLPERPGLYQ